MSNTVGIYRSGVTEIAVDVWERSYIPNGTRRGIIFAHGYGVNPDLYYNENFPLGYLHKFTEMNVPAVIPMLGGVGTFGNDDCIKASEQAFTWLQTSPNLRARSDKVLLVGGSMGSLTVLNYAIYNPSKVAAIVCELPGCDLQDVHDFGTLNGSYFNTVIEDAYGGYNNYVSALPTHSPTLNASVLTNIPIQLVYSTNDPVVRPQTVLAFAEKLGPMCELVSLGAVGHDATTADRTAQAQFLARHASP